jgi:hypothetical protein
MARVVFGRQSEAAPFRGYLHANESDALNLARLMHEGAARERGAA